MQRLQHQSIHWLEFNLLADIPKIRHGVFLREGGNSLGAFHSLNTSYLVGDDEKHVTANLAQINQLILDQTFTKQKIVQGIGCHGKYIENIYSQSANEILNCDGLMTCHPHISLLMKHADCQIALFYDPINHCIANIHAGWRGNVQNIYMHAIDQMKARFGTNPANLLVCISPSLGPEEAEFINYKVELPEDFWQFQVQPTYFDLWTLSEYQLQNAGVLPHHIEIARLSTYSNPHDFFSFRRDNKVTGRHTTYITLLP